MSRNPVGMRKFLIPGVISSGRSTGARAPRISRRRSYRLLRAHAENTRRQGGKGEGGSAEPDRTGHDKTRQQQGSAAPASRAAVRTDGGHVRVYLVEFGFIFRLVKFLGLFVGVL